MENLEKTEVTSNDGQAQENKGSEKKVEEVKTTTIETPAKDTVEETNTEFEEGKETTEDKAKNSELEEQKKRNADFAKQRREKEKAEQERKAIEHKAKLEGIKTALKGVNPYTNEALESDEDVEHYLTQVEMEKEGLDPTSLIDFRKFQKTQVEKNKPINEKEFVTKDSEDFLKKYPDVKFDEIFSDQNFIAFVDKFYKEEIGKTIPLAKIYRNFLTYKEERAEFDKLVEKKATELFEKRLAKVQSSSGGVEKKANESELYYTMEQIEKMSVEEIRKNMEKVDRSLEYHRKTKK